MKTRVIHTRFWKDEFIGELSLSEKIIFIYLLTNDKVNICGIYEITDREVIFDTGVSSDQLAKAKKRLHEAGKILFYNSWVKIVNVDKYNSYKGDSNNKCRAKELELAPSELRTDDTSVGTSDETSVGGGATLLEIRNKKLEIKNKKQEKEGGLILSNEEIDEFQSVFTGANVKKEYRTAQDWLASTGKTKKDYRAFFRNWLRRVSEEKEKQEPFLTATDGRKFYSQKELLEAIKKEEYEIIDKSVKPPIVARRIDYAKS